MSKTTIIPDKLNPGDEIRVVAPSRSLSIVSQSVRNIAISRLTSKGYKITFGENVDKIDDFSSSSIEDRIKDLHQAFRDTKVKAILTAIGGHNSNQLLDKLDYQLIKNNPKIFMGFSDITTLCNAIFVKTGLITYYGPHFSSWGMEQEFDYTAESFAACIEKTNEYKILPSDTWSDDPWFIEQKVRFHEKNDGAKVWNNGMAEGRIVGGNLSTFVLLAGTKYWPGLEETILLIEDDEETTPQLFDRYLQTITMQPDFTGVKAVIIGRFQKNSGMSDELLEKILVSKSALKNIPIVSDINFGHTTPISVFPIGGRLKLIAKNEKYEIIVKNH
jgi:muramoyltetrapeptide carboxypeptidase LdcA involved in peptidoglycan recycling